VLEPVHPGAAQRLRGCDGVDAQMRHGDYVKDEVEKRRTYVTGELLEKAKELYRAKGISYTLWWYLKEVWQRRKHPVKFEDLFRLHKYVAGVRSKNSTLKALRRLEMYGLVQNLGGWYKPLILDESIAEGSIDFSRVRTRDQVLRRKGAEEVQHGQPGEIPRELEPVIKAAKELIEKGEKWKAVDLLAHTVLPVRETGVLLARKNDLFLYYERKTNKMHMIKSEKLAKLFDALGIKDEVLLMHRQHEADSIIKRLFGSHDNARRLHYLLKERGWFEYPQENYYYRVFQDFENNSWWISIYRLDKSGRMEEIWRIQTAEETAAGLQVKAGAIVTREHIKEENETTYLHRTKGWV